MNLMHSGNAFETRSGTARTAHVLPSQVPSGFMPLVPPNATSILLFTLRRGQSPEPVT